MLCFVAGPPGFQPGATGSEDPRLINQVSSGNHNLGTLSTNDYPYRISGRIIWKHLCRKRLIGS